MAVNRPAIGVESVVYAVLTESTDVVGGTPTWGTVAALAPVAKVEFKQNGSIATDFGDDAPNFVATTTGKLQATIELFDVQESEYATILGAATANGLVADGARDSAPWVAIGYKQWLGGVASDGVTRYYRYKWLLKGRFSKPDQGGDTKKETINFKHVTLNAEFVPLISSTAGYYQMTLRTDTSTASAAFQTAYFTQPVYTLSQDLGAFVLTSGVGSAASHFITLTFTKTAASTTTLTTVAPITSANFSMSTIAGTAVSGTFTYAYGVASTTPTVTITNALIVTATYVCVGLTTIKDANGVGITAEKALIITVT
jgi:phi13 family phage major tail protein